MKWHISSWLFTKLDDFLLFVIYMVEWSLHNKKLIHNSWKTEIWFLTITEPCRCQFEATVFNQELLLYCTLSLYRLMKGVWSIEFQIWFHLIFSIYHWVQPYSMKQFYQLRSLRYFHFFGFSVAYLVIQLPQKMVPMPQQTLIGMKGNKILTCWVLRQITKISVAGDLSDKRGSWEAELLRTVNGPGRYI